jgi:competence protein ComEA
MEPAGLRLRAVVHRRSIRAAFQPAHDPENKTMKRLLFLVSSFAFSTFAFAATVNLNSATQAQIAPLPQMGPVKAKAIVDYRTANGCFKSVNDLLKVKGMTKADIEALKGLVDVASCPQGSPSAPAKAQT